MTQWNSQLLEWNAQQWEHAMSTTDNFCAEIRPRHMVDQHEDVAGFKACMGSSTKRVAKALECIDSRGYLGADMDALDIGSGNGVFTLPLSQRYRRVTSLDISVAMQNEIRSQAREQGIRNIDYMNADWKNLNLKTAGMEKKYDLVLCSINPRGICNYETLDKMNQASRGGCCLMTFAGRGSSNHKTDLQQIILGRNLGTTGGNNIIFPFNIAYHMGGEPTLDYTTVSWEHRQKPEEAIESICFSYWRFADITEEIREKISDYVYANLEDGFYVDRSENLIGIMVWDAWRTREKRLA